MNIGCVRGRALFAFLLALAMAAALLVVGTSVGAAQAHQTLAVEAAVAPFALSQVHHPLRFEIQGAVGVYELVNTAEYTLQANVPVLVKLEASPLAYVDDDAIALDVVYWVTTGTNTTRFKPGQAALINFGFDRYRTRHLQMGGQVTIHGVADQPAGSYEGTIWITVTGN